MARESSGACYQQWFLTVAGQLMAAEEKNELSNILSRVFGYHLVMLGEIGLAENLSESKIAHRIFITSSDTKLPFGTVVQGDNEAIPLQTDSVDGVVLAHCLEQSAHPHQVLREAYRILRPEGHIIITGFNPISTMGIWYNIKNRLNKKSLSGHLLSLSRIKDWLELLDFEIMGQQRFFFRPPIHNAKMMERLAFLDRWGPKLFPLLGGGYILFAVKRVITLTPIKPKWKKEASLWPATETIPNPTTSQRKSELKK